MYCSKKCFQDHIKKGLNGSFQTVRKKMKEKEMLIECQRCGFNSHPNILNVHHIDRNRKNNHLSNLEVLCPNCHMIEHLKD